MPEESQAVGPLPADLSRSGLLERLERETFDIAVVGGGITGAGIARDAAMRGLSVALVEKGDFASGTSSRSSRLIHGGLRYLRQRHLGLVREGLRERGLLLRQAPHLVKRAPFTLPVYGTSRDSPLILRLGLAGYDLLAGSLGIGRHRFLSREATLREEPQLQARGLRGAARYYDAVTCDARLTLAVALSALQNGAAAANYVEAVGFEKAGGRIAGVHFRDRLCSRQGTIHARVIVSAAGPWTDHVRSMAGASRILRPTKGIHLVVPRSRLSTNTVISFYEGDRLLFAVPHGQYTYVGTTDTDWTGDPGDAEADPKDIAYLLEAANANFTAELSMTDVISTWAGVRPLLSEEGSPSDISRDYEILHGPPGLYTIAGGKLTTFRSMAERLVDQIIEKEGRRFRNRLARSRTASEPLPGGGFGDFARYEKEAVAALRESWQLPEASARRLVAVYGTEHVRVLSYAVSEPDLLQPLAPECPVLAAEVVYAAGREMAATLEDFLRRRSDLMLFCGEERQTLPNDVARLMAGALGWERRETRRQLAAYRKAVAGMTAFRA